MRNVFLPLAAGIVAFIAALCITSGHGPGLDPDSAAYLGAAGSLAHGDGLRVPMGKWENPDSTVELTVWPPAFSAATAVPEMMGFAPLASARLVIAAAAATTAATLAVVLAGAVNLTVLCAAMLIVLVTPSFVGVHMSVLSEPLFIASLAVTLLAMVRGRPGLAAASATLAVMTRYAGASAALGTAAWFLFFEKGAPRQRFLRAALSSAPAAVAFALWIAHNARVKVVQSAMSVEYYPGIGATLREGLGTMLAWLAPGARGAAAAVIGGAVFLSLAAAGISFFARRDARIESDETSARRISAAAAVLLTSYLAVLICSRLFIGGAIRFDARILSPAIFLIEVVAIALCGSALADRGLTWRVVASLAAVMWMVAALAADAPAVLDSIEDGNDFAASDWRESPTVEWVAREGAGHPIYTNWPAAIIFDARRNAYDIPGSTDADTLALFGRILASRKGLLAAFNERSPDYPPIDSIAAGAGLTRVREFSDGAIWAAGRNVK